MKLTVEFQTLVLAVIALALTIATAVWATVAYNSVYDIILSGFDRKLLALSGGAAVFTDGDAHRDYQRPYAITALAAADAGALWGFDETRSRLVRIDPADGGAVETGERLPQLKSIAFAPDTNQWYGLSKTGAVLAWREGMAPAPAALATPPPESLDEIFFWNGVLYARAGQRVGALDGNVEAFELAQPVRHLAPDPESGELIGLAADGSALLRCSADGAVLESTAIALSERATQGLVATTTGIFIAADSLLRVDRGSIELFEDFSPGYYSEQHPFFARYAPMYRRVREDAGLTFLYTEQFLGGDTIRYILDGSVGDDHSPPGYLDTVPEESIADMSDAQSRGRAFVSGIREWDIWGLIKVSAQPIVAADGEVVALAGADVDIGVIRSKTRYALFAVLFVGALLLLLAGLVSVRVASAITQPLREIKNGALSIAAGHFGTRLLRKGRDEIGRLAQSLDRLSVQLETQTREARGYQQTLVQGRLRLALTHALLSRAALLRGVARGHIDPGRAAIESRPVGATIVTAGSLHWRLSAQSDALRSAIVSARCIALSELLLTHQAPATALAALWRSVPELHVGAAWDTEEAHLHLRVRETLRMHLQHADGGTRELQVTDGMALAIDEGALLRFADGVVLFARALPEAIV